MRIERFLPVVVILFAVVISAGGCIGKGTQRPTKNYVLNSLYSVEPQPQTVTELNTIGILVGPVRLPLYLDRSEIVTRNSLNEVEIADFAKWAGPLQENFTRVLAEDLAVLLSTDRVGIFPGERARLFDYNVTVYVTRFDGMLGEKAHLRARWVILDKKRKTVLFEKHTVQSQSTENESMRALIAAQSHTLTDLSREIAGAIKALAEGKNPG
ncbi:MAG: membrane integrity-associated transporter subunit PqiC [Desulfobacterales bacterium]|nr:membrane integrity-associated transporter subunit PqiC [Desulfobacterales bacterium]